MQIDGVPVQCLPAYNALLLEALSEASEFEYGKTTTRVLRAEHLIAICVQTGREKDRMRVDLFFDEASIDERYLLEILSKHGLSEKWKKWTARD